MPDLYEDIRKSLVVVIVNLISRIFSLLQCIFSSYMKEMQKSEKMK